jgi:iron complex transport system ATP-binding protein
MLVARDIDVTLGRAPVLRGVGLALAPGEVLAVLGPNGAGKSTLLAVLSGAEAPDAGWVGLDDRPLAAWAPAALARRRAVLPQHSELVFAFTAFEVALLGRSPHAGRSSRARDLAAVVWALTEAEVAHLADRVYTTLSGGERQRVQLARVLAQIGPLGPEAPDAARYLLLDEPTSSLDLAHQHATLAAARRAASAGVAVLVVLHDLNLAAMYADRLLVLSAGRIAAEGGADAVLSEALVADVFDLEVRVTRHPTRDCLHLVAI